MQSTLTKIQKKLMQPEVKQAGKQQIQENAKESILAFLKKAKQDSAQRQSNRKKQQRKQDKKCLDIPVWRRYTLTIEEAAGYYHIGEGKLRMLIDEHPNEDFYVMNGNRALIKREKFERYLDQATAV